MSRKKEKLNKRIVLKKLYTLDVYDKNGEKVPWDQDYLPYYKQQKAGWEYDTELHPAISYDRDINLTKLMTPDFIKMVQDNVDYYDKIEIDWDQDCDGDVGYATVVGIRKETDGEQEQRLEEEERIKREEEEAKLLRAKEKAAKKKQTELDELKRLKEKYDK